MFKSELIAEACLDRIVHKSKRFELKGESLRKNINFAADTEDYQPSERISPELVNGYHRNTQENERKTAKILGTFRNTFYLSESESPDPKNGKEYQ